MKHYWLRLFPEQPLYLDDETVIPAGAVRGAIAAILLSTCLPGHEHDTGPCGADCRYWSLFGEGATIRIGPAYAGSGDETLPFLATARTCSVSPGFKVTGGHGVFDVAIRQWVFEQACSDSKRLAGLLVPFSQRCPTCDAAPMPCQGTVTRQGEREFTQVGDVATPVTTAHVSLGRARKQIAGRYEVIGKAINAGVYYVARLDVSDRHDSLLREALAGGLWIGGRRSRGMGAMRAELVPRPADAPTLDERIARFNRAIRAEHRFYAAMDVNHAAGDEGDWYFTLDLYSAAPAACEAAPSIAPVLATLPAVVPVRQWLSPQVIGGWHAAAGLPRRTQIGASGVILYRVPAETNRQAVAEVLAFLEAEGIEAMGRDRGFGLLTICDPFHLIVDAL